MWARTYPNSKPADIRLDIAGKSYFRDSILDLRTRHALFSSEPAVGQCVIGEINVKMLVSPDEIPRGAELRPCIILRDEEGNEEELPKGVYYIYQRTVDRKLEQVQFIGYDAMIKMNQTYTTTDTQPTDHQGRWPLTDMEVVEEVCQRIGVELDSRTVLEHGYEVQYPGYGDGAYTMREVMEAIAAMYGGNWVMTDDGMLNLIRFGITPPESHILVDQRGSGILIGGVHILV